MTGTAAPTKLPALKHGGGLRRIVVLAGCATVWGAAVLLLSAGFVPQLAGDETELGIRVTFLLGGLLVAVLPVLALWLPHRRQVARLLDGVLATDLAQPQVPPVAAWAHPEVAFQRLRSTAFVLSITPLLTLLILGLGSSMYLDEDASGTVALAFCLVPLAGLVATLTLPTRVLTGVQTGIDRGQVLAVRVPSRVDLGTMAWLQAFLPDGRELVLRTPSLSPRAPEPRGVVDSPDVVLVVGAGGHQGALLVPARPEEVVWLHGPVPQVRVPRDVIRAFEELAARTG
ncbi:MAG: hypothetical protein JWO22_2848 [Frankiales bacterium]|nr:hypothetical protein [Frankiales bacterium]